MAQPRRVLAAREQHKLFVMPDASAVPLYRLEVPALAVRLVAAKVDTVVDLDEY